MNQGLKCKYCGNDDTSLLEELTRTKKFKGDIIWYLCLVCSKQFMVITNEEDTESHS